MRSKPSAKSALLAGAITGVGGPILFAALQAASLPNPWDRYAEILSSILIGIVPLSLLVAGPYPDPTQYTGPYSERMKAGIGRGLVWFLSAALIGLATTQVLGLVVPPR